MPKQSFSMFDFKGGMNHSSNGLDIDLLPKKQVRTANKVHFDNAGTISRAEDYPTFDDGNVVTSGNVSYLYKDLDIGIGHSSPSNTAALDIAIADVDSPTDTLSWEDGGYSFRYTVCRDLGNGIIEEGPLQAFKTAANCTNVDMSGDSKGKFTFTHSGDGADDPGHPEHFDSDYEGKICGRVYYARTEGQGYQSQTGYIHLCDLILTDYDAADKVLPRPVDQTGTPTNNYINIEEPPSASSFEMNSGYPSDVGILDVSSSVGIFSLVEAKTTIGLVTYVAKDGYIYRNVPGQPDIWPSDNWIDMTKYGTTAPSGSLLSGPCSAMYGTGNILMYFTQNELILFDVNKDLIVKEMKGYGLEHKVHSCQCEEGVVWLGGNLTNAFEDASYQGTSYDFAPSVYYFNGQEVRDLNSNRVLLSSAAQEQLQYNKERRWLKFGGSSGSESIACYYSFNSDTWFHDQTVSNGYSSQPSIEFPAFTNGEPGRIKKIYKIIVHGGGTSPTLQARDEDQSNIVLELQSGGDSYQTEYKPSSSCKVKELYLKFMGQISALYPFKGISIIYRMTNKF